MVAVASRYAVEPVQEADLRSVMRLAWTQRSPPLPGIFFAQAAQQEPQRFRVVRDTQTGDVVGFVLTARLPLRDRSMLLLGVRPELVGLGLRRALLREVETTLRNEGEREIRIEVPVGAHDLLDFYKAQGFELIGRADGPGGEEFILSSPLLA